MTFADIRHHSVSRTPEEMVKNLERFKLDLKFSAGIWYFSLSDSRFHAKYKPDIDIKKHLEIAEFLAVSGSSEGRSGS